MKILLKTALAGIALLSMSAHADGILNSYVSMRIDANASRIWEIVKDYDSLNKWHPVFPGDVLKSGTNNEVGAIRTLTVKDGPSFDEELLTWSASDRKFTYRIIDPNPLPLAEYSSSFQVMQISPGVSDVTWRSAYRNNSNGEMSDDELIAFLNGVYKAGLDAVKGMVE